jgi:large subunit ribosomal protein L15
MSLLAELRPNKGATKDRKRVGRGHSTGQGGTAGKGHKGQKARAGGRVRWGFEGGQTPLMRRLPKFGFSNKNFATEYDIVKLDQLETMSGEVGPEAMKKAGWLYYGRIKILANGKLTKSLQVKAHKFSAGAKEAIEKAGGRAEVIE